MIFKAQDVHEIGGAICEGEFLILVHVPTSTEVRCASTSGAITTKRRMKLMNQLREMIERT